MPARKKDPSVRARRNKASTAATLSRPVGGKVPPMPEGVDWHEETKRWWHDVWSSPMSPEWDASDVHNVGICALTFNDIWAADTARERKDAAGEYRLQSARLGLSPYDRRRLEWTRESADEAKDRGAQRRARRAPAPAAGDDPRSVLRAVN